MLLRHSLTLVLAMGAGLLITDSRAADADPGTGSIGFQLGFYDQPDSDGTAGNPFLDEELTVIEPVILFDYQVNEEDAIWALFSYDYISSASIDRLSKFPQQSGASGDYYVGLDLGWRRQLDARTSRGLFVSGSVEYDYLSFGLGGDYDIQDPETGAGLKFSANGFIDSIKLIRFDGSEDGNDTKFTLTSSVNGYRPMAPRLHAAYGASLTLQNGFLGTAYNAVVIEDGSGPNPNLVNNALGREVTEILPDVRIRGAVYGTLKQSIAKAGAVELGSRIYADDWGISSFSLRPGYGHWLVPDRHRLSVYYRFYIQSEADDFSTQFTTETTRRTQDADLGDFSAHTLGGQWTWSLSETDEVYLGGGYTARSDDLDYTTLHSGYVHSF